MSERDTATATGALDLRSFRQGLNPRKTLGQVARGARMSKSYLSRIETGRKRITVAYACRLAQFFRRASGCEVTAGQVIDMAERAAARRSSGEPGPHE